MLNIVKRQLYIHNKTCHLIRLIQVRDGKVQSELGLVEITWNI